MKALGDFFLTSLISTLGWIVFIFTGGYVAVMTNIQPWWLKFLIVVGIGFLIIVLCALLHTFIESRFGVKKAPTFSKKKDVS